MLLAFCVAGLYHCTMQDPKLKPSWWYYVVAGVVMAAGVTWFTWFLLTGLTGLATDMTQMVLPGEHELELSEAGTYTVFHEYKSVVDGKVYSTAGDLSNLYCTLVAVSSGKEMPLPRSTMNSTYSLGTRAGASVFECQVNEPGKYVFSAAYPNGRTEPEVVFTIGHGFTRSLLTIIFGSMGIMGGSFILAAVIAVITAIRRSNYRKRLTPPLTP